MTGGDNVDVDDIVDDNVDVNVDDITRQTK